MRALRFALLALSRDWRSGELAVLLAALLVAVTALTGVGFFTDRIAQAVQQRAAEVLAADLRLNSTKSPDAAYEVFAAKNGIETARTLSFPSVVFFGDESALAAVRAASAGDPLRGRIKVSDAPFGAARETDALPGRGEAWLDPRLLARLGARVGDRVNVGASSFVVAQVLDYRPDQGSAFVDLAPSLLMPLAELEATELLGPGSRATWSLLFAGPPADVSESVQDANEVWDDEAFSGSDHLRNGPQRSRPDDHAGHWLVLNGTHGRRDGRCSGPSRERTRNCLIDIRCQHLVFGKSASLCAYPKR